MHLVGWQVASLSRLIFCLLLLARLPFVKPARTWGIAAYLVLLIERISRAVQLGPQPAFNPAQIRRYEGATRELHLELPYYPARSARGYEFIPKDGYFQQTEEVLQHR